MDRRVGKSFVLARFPNGYDGVAICPLGSIGGVTSCLYALAIGLQHLLMYRLRMLSQQLGMEPLAAVVRNVCMFFPVHARKIFFVLVKGVFSTLHGPPQLCWPRSWFFCSDCRH